MDRSIPANVATDAYIELLKKCITASIYDESAWTLCQGFRSGKPKLFDGLRKAFFRWLGSRGYAVVRTRPFDSAKREEGADWPLFGYSMAGHKRLDNIEHCVRTILDENIPGDFLETGVWRGGSCLFMKALLNHWGDSTRSVWLADSFEGLPKPKSATDRNAKGHDLSACEFLKVSVEQVQENFERFGLLDDRVHFLKGWFCDTLPDAPIGQLALLRLDGDLYDSTRDALLAMYHRVVPGGFVIVDDYGSWTGCREAISEFRAKNQIEAEMVPIDFTGVYWRVPMNQPQVATPQGSLAVA